MQPPTFFSVSPLSSAGQDTDQLASKHRTEPKEASCCLTGGPWEGRRRATAPVAVVLLSPTSSSHHNTASTIRPSEICVQLVRPCRHLAGTLALSASRTPRSRAVQARRGCGKRPSSAGRQRGTVGAGLCYTVQCAPGFAAGVVCCRFCPDAVAELHS